MRSGKKEQKREEQKCSLQHRNWIPQRHGQPSTSSQQSGRCSVENSPASSPRSSLGQREQRNNLNGHSCSMHERNEASGEYFYHSEEAEPVSITYLENLLQKESSEILSTICQKDSAFMAFIGQKNIGINMIALVITIIGKACLGDLGQVLCSLLISIHFKPEFFSTIEKFVVSLQMNHINEIQKQSMYYLTVFLQKIQYVMPSSSIPFISSLLPLLRFRSEIFLREQSFYGDIMQKLQEIEEQNEAFLNHYPECNIQESSNSHENTEPPKNFKLLSVIPTANDIHSRPFLHRNVINGKYKNAEHYLDVQYCFLREDYVRPIRDGIKEYIKLKEDNKSIENIQNVRVYENVHIVKKGSFEGHIVYFAEFKDLEGIDLEEYTDFLSSSLLCLSSDKFKTVIFATIVKRITNNNILIIKFENITDDILSISPLKNFVVLETSADFEAYRCNMKALQDISKYSLPFKKYIVDAKTKVNNVPYLDLSTTYDLRPLLLPMDCKFVKRTEMTEGDFTVQNEFAAGLSNDLQSVQLLKDSSWPTPSDLKLDDSQYLALKAALTKDFVIIQGPPGTGKTYIGLRIVQLLLHNLENWFTRELNYLPILVICHTNHALDKFLEGMMDFTDKIVRISGEETKKAFSNFHLCNIKKRAFHEGVIPLQILEGLKDIQNKISCITHKIDEANYVVQRCVQTVLGDNDLIDFIPFSQYCSLKIIQYSKKFRDLKLIDDNLLIHDWLGIRSRLDEKDATDLDRYEIEESNQELNEEEHDEKIKYGNLRDNDMEEDHFLLNSLYLEETEDVCSAPSHFSIVGIKKEKLKFIKNRLITSKPLEESEAQFIYDFWNIDLDTRWSLYKYWVEKIITEKKKEISELEARLNYQHELLQELRIEEDIFVLQDAQVLGMTTNLATKHRELVQKLNPQILIVEEAAEILESHIVTSLAPNTQQVILIGDHQQLRPSPTVHKQAVEYNLNISLFERMVTNKIDCYNLTLQHRMKPEIADLMAGQIYSTLKNHESVTKYENVKGVDKSMYFIDHDYRELQEKNSKSKINEHEAKFLIKLCVYLIQQGYKQNQITILTTYSSQVKLLKNIQSKQETITDVKITTVDNYQGEENDIILISLVRSNEEDNIGFLNVSNRICVAMSRAKKGLYCIGNFESLARKSELWRNITNSLSNKKAIGKSLKLTCQNHPEETTCVAHERDFMHIPDGSCSKNCDFRLSCGHVCSFTCHTFDKMHTSIRCQNTCDKTCKDGHRCQKKCSEDCGSCEQLVDKTLPSCKHTIKVPCGEQHMDIECGADCDSILICGHKCPNKCSVKCADACREIITVQSSICGHDVAVQCRYKHYAEELIKNCTNPCTAILRCGHKCSGNCNLCRQGRLHVECMEPCRKILVCGHECKSNCAKGCPPCKQPCENRCIHGTCPNECGMPCDLCFELCEWYCPHATCSRSCREKCDRDPCNQPCLKLLQCGHPCIGFCGEPCPKLCRICDRDEVEEIFFGTEDEKDARFVQMKDCHHFLEISGLNAWMSIETDGEIQMKVCPKCKTAVRTNLRYSNTVKDCLEKIEKVKRVTYGNTDELRELKQHLVEIIHENEFVLQNILYRGLSFYDICTDVLSSKRHLNKTEIRTMIQIVKSSVDVAKMSFNTVCSVFKSYISASEIWLLDFMVSKTITASFQQLQQVVDEIRRLELCYKFSDYTKNRAISSFNPDYFECISILTSYAHFAQEKEVQLGEAFRRLAASCGSAIIAVTEEERRSILSAMNLPSGHWFQCPNGHVYCITECGGAMEEGRCNECNATIGGTSHALVETNRVATDMDGALYAAWSEEANLAMDVEQLEFDE